MRARLSNPLPKTQAVKGGMYGGFRIGQDGGGSFSKLGNHYINVFMYVYLSIHSDNLKHALLLPMILSLTGRGIGRGGHGFNQANLQRGRGFYHRGRNQTGRIGFVGEYDFDNRYPELHARQNFVRGNLMNLLKYLFF